jgi:hypothetical protein
MSNSYGAVYYPPLENLPTFDVLVFRNAQDVTDYAINSENSLITNTTSGTPYYPTFVDTSSGYRRIRTNDPSYTYNANTNTISANTSGTSAVATAVTINNTSTAAIYYPTFVRNASGNEIVRVYSPTFTYDLLINSLTVNISGTAVSASTITIADDDSATTYYLTFASAGVGNKSLLYDSITTPLAYVPSTNTLTINNLSSVVAITPSNARSVLLNGTPIGNGGNTTCVFMGTNAGTPSPTIAPNNNFCFGTNSGSQLSAGGVQNLFIGANSGNLVTSGRNNCFLGASAGRKTTTGTYNTQIGGQSQSFPDENFSGSYNTTIGAESHISVDGLSYSTAIGANVVASTSNTVRIGRSADTTIFDGLVTNTIAQPAAGDSSTLMPTTAWVQTAITAGSVTTTANIALTSDDTAGSYYIPFSKTTSATSNALYIDNTTTPLVYNPFENEISATKYSLGGLAPVSGANAGFFAQNIGSFATVIQNQATSGSVFLYTRTALNALTTSLSVSSTTASFNAANITLNSGTLNVGHGAGSVSNTIIGASTPSSIVFTTGSNTLIGTSAGQNMTIAAASNTCLGNSSGLGITSGTQNTFIGSLTGFQTANGTGSSNVCVGYQAGDSMTTTANENTIIGTQSGTAVSTGTDNVIIGFNAAASLTTGSNNIVIGSGANVLAAAANQIAIGTATETMFIKGGFNWRVGSQITSTATGNLATAVLAQFYTVAMSAAAQTIALPNPTGAAYLGARVTFKRKTNTTVFTLTSTGGAGFVPIGSITLSASPHSVAAGIFQVDLVCDGTNWCIIGQA